MTTKEQLREEIAEIIKESDCGAPIERYYDDADESINKVLDAVVDGLESLHNPCQAVSTPAFLRIRNDAIKSINKLRP